MICLFSAIYKCWAERCWPHAGADYFFGRRQGAGIAFPRRYFALQLIFNSRADTWAYFWREKASPERETYSRRGRRSSWRKRSFGRFWGLLAILWFSSFVRSRSRHCASSRKAWAPKTTPKGGSRGILGFYLFIYIFFFLPPFSVGGPRSLCNEWTKPRSDGHTHALSPKRPASLFLLSLSLFFILLHLTFLKARKRARVWTHTHRTA